MLRPRARPRRGFTVIEILLAVTILAVLVTVLVPMVTDDDRLRLRAAASILASDIELAQVMTISHPNYPVVVRFSGVDTYWLALADDPNRPIKRMGTDEDYLVVFGQGRAGAAAGVRIQSVSMSDRSLEFNGLGGLDDTSPALIGLHLPDSSSTLRVSLSISATTGMITEDYVN